jgi:DNA-binding winged helix-turn-helix (wHTH) protein
MGVAESSGRLRFSDVEIDLRSGAVSRGGAPVPLRPLATRALLLLVRRRGETVTRDELRRELWGETVVCWNLGLNQVVRQVRRALGDDGRSPRFVETVARRGYRLKAELPAATADGDLRLEAAQAAAERIGYLSAGVAAALALPVLIVLACALLAR